MLEPIIEIELTEGPSYFKDDNAPEAPEGIAKFEVVAVPLKETYNVTLLPEARELFCMMN